MHFHCQSVSFFTDNVLNLNLLDPDNKLTIAE